MTSQRAVVSEIEIRQSQVSLPDSVTTAAFGQRGLFQPRGVPLSPSAPIRDAVRGAIVRR